MSRRTLTLLPIAAAGMVVTACSPHDPRACTPPRSYWPVPRAPIGIQPITSVIALTRDGAIRWNGDSVSFAALRQYLETSHRLNPEPQIVLDTEMGISCRMLERVRNQMDRALECRKPYARCAEGLRPVREDTRWGAHGPVS
ncbi:hypothetical protein GCM10009102_21900 [Sphingomonas insulae]|uniref:Lipoprotein n=2 Tax=Sphingomonas insulae TaxID=424800 RepID=A0ABN1HWG4_9SPHN